MSFVFPKQQTVQRLQRKNLRQLRGQQKCKYAKGEIENFHQSCGQLSLIRI